MSCLKRVATRFWFKKGKRTTTVTLLAVSFCRLRFWIIKVRVTLLSNLSGVGHLIQYQHWRELRFTQPLAIQTSFSWLYDYLGLYRKDFSSHLYLHKVEKIALVFKWLPRFLIVESCFPKYVFIVFIDFHMHIFTSTEYICVFLQCCHLLTLHESPKRAFYF